MNSLKIPCFSSKIPCFYTKMTCFPTRNPFKCCRNDQNTLFYTKKVCPKTNLFYIKNAYLTELTLLQLCSKNHQKYLFFTKMDPFSTNFSYLCSSTFKNLLQDPKTTLKPVNHQFLTPW